MTDAKTSNSTRSFSLPGRYTCEVRVGRLIEARIAELRSPDDAQSYSKAIQMAVATYVGQGPDAGPVLLADHRPAPLYRQDVADELAALFARMNPRLAHVAILASTSNATLMLQLGRIVREANNPNRQLFSDADEGMQFLSKVLNDEELARARRFTFSI